jgi:hypothetical protein
MPEYLAPGVYVKEIEIGAKSIVGVRELEMFKKNRRDEILKKINEIEIRPEEQYA